MKRVFNKTIACLLAILILLSSMLPISAFAVSNSQMASKVVSVARNEVGYESGSSQSKYGDWIGHQGSWCTYFALWCFNEAGNSLGVNLFGTVTPKGGNCNSMISWYKNKGRYHTRGDGYTPNPGDMIFFDWKDNGSSQHVGIVESISGSTVYTIEGNCSGKVKARKYTTTGSKPYNNVSSILGYASIDWGKATGIGDSVVNTTKKETTTKKQKPTTTKKHEKETQTTKKVTTTTTTQAPVVLASEINIEATVDTISVGDTIKLNYSVKPAGATAVVGYFCDQDDIVEIEPGGKIKAKSPGSAIIVLCANDDIYEQYTLNVVEPKSNLLVNDENIYDATRQHYDKTTKDKLTEFGINVDVLLANKDLFLIPLAISGITLLVAGSIAIVKKFSNKKSNKDE